MVTAVFNRSDGQLAINNGQTLMNVDIVDKEIPGAYVIATANGDEIRGLEPGSYLVSADLPMAADPGWYALTVFATGGAKVSGASVSEQLNASNGYCRPKCACVLTVTSAEDGIWVRTDSNHEAAMRDNGTIAIIRF